MNSSKYVFVFAFLEKKITFVQVCLVTIVVHHSSRAYRVTDGGGEAQGDGEMPRCPPLPKTYLAEDRE